MAIRAQDTNQDWFDANQPETPQGAPTTTGQVTTGQPATPQRGPGTATTPTTGAYPGSSVYANGGSTPITFAPGTTLGGGSTTPPPQGTLSAPADGDWQTWFQNLVKGQPSSYAAIKQLEPQLANAGVKVNYNLEGDPSKLILPNGHYVSVVDEGGKWRWMDQGTSADAAKGSGAFSFPGWNDTFSYAPWDKTFQAPDGITEQNDPGYKDRMALGADAIQRSALAQGTGLTGGTLKDLEQFGQTFGSTEYGNVYGRALNDYNTALDAYKLNYNTAAQQYNQRYQQYGDNYNRAYQSYMGNFGVSNTLNQEGFANSLSLANLGLAGALGTNTAAGQYGAGAANTTTQIGNVNASGQVGAANATNTSIANITNGLQPYLYGTQSSYRKAPADQQGYPGQYGGG